MISHLIISQIHFFAHLTVAKLISMDSMLALLRSFTAVLDEFGVSYGRAKQAALCAGEGLLVAGAVLKEHSATDVEEIISAIQAYADTTTQQKWLVSPATRISSQAIPHDSAVEVRFYLISLSFTGTSFSFTAPGNPSLHSDNTQPVRLQRDSKLHSPTISHYSRF